MTWNRSKRAVLYNKWNLVVFGRILACFLFCHFAYRALHQYSVTFFTVLSINVPSLSSWNFPSLFCLFLHSTFNMTKHIYVRHGCHDERQNNTVWVINWGVPYLTASAVFTCVSVVMALLRRWMDTTADTKRLRIVGYSEGISSHGYWTANCQWTGMHCQENNEACVTYNWGQKVNVKYWIFHFRPMAKGYVRLSKQPLH
jgi:hypothetical protein